MRFIARHRVLVMACLAVVVGLVVFVAAYFEPQKLFIDQRVDEAAPTVSPVATATAGQPEAASPTVQPAPVQPPAPVTSARGSFRSLEHKTTGEALVVELGGGNRVLRLEGFVTSNGPDLRVYLSAGSDDSFLGRAYGKDFVELGKLKGNIGTQNYAIPEAADLLKYRNAVIWCKRFSVGFGVATLDPSGSAPVG